MTERRFPGWFGAVLTLALLGLPFGPARADMHAATAGITSARAIAAGSALEYVHIEVTAPQALPTQPRVNYVRIDPPLALSMYVAQDPVMENAAIGDAPPGWTGTRLASGSVVFQTTNLAAMLIPGLSAEFVVRISAGRPASDLVRQWTVLTKTSAPPDQNPVAAQPSEPDALTLAIKVLTPLSAQISGPEAAAEQNQATVDQDNVQVTCVVQNAGSATLSVTAQITGGEDSSAIQVLSSPGARNIGAGNQRAYVFNVKMGQSPAEIEIECSAASGTITGLQTVKTEPIAVVDKATLTYIPESLGPQKVFPGSEPAFRVRVRKEGPVDVVLSESSTFTFASFSSSLAEPTELTSGSAGTELTSGSAGTELLFGSETVQAAIADGAYTPNVQLVGTDSNGASVNVALSLEDTVVVDRVGPIPNPVLRASQLLREPDAATDPTPANMAKVVFDGTIDSQGQKCDDCAIEQAVIRQFREDGTRIDEAETDVSDSISNEDGDIVGEYAGAFHPEATDIRLRVTVEGRVSSSPAFPVDNTAPSMQLAFTGGPQGTDNQVITVVFSKRVEATVPLPTDWLVTVDTTPNAVEEVSFEGNEVVLGLARALGEDDRPQLSYLGCPELAPACVGKYEDTRVGLALRNNDVPMEVEDRVVPRTPVILTASREGTANSVMGLQDGKLYTNSSTPTIGVITVTDGHRVQVWHDVNGNGVVNPGTDVILCVADAPQPCVSANLGTVNKEIQLLARVFDPHGNRSVSEPVPLVLDFTPVGVRAHRQDSEIVVVFTKEIAGRDNSEDWAALAVVDGFEDAFAVSVEGMGDTRTLAVLAAIEETPTKVRYLFTGSLAIQRYEDRAGNVVSNFVTTIQAGPA